MDRAGQPTKIPPTAKVVDFDEALLDTLTPEARGQLLAEAALLAQAFAPEGRGDELRAMARTLSLGEHDAEMDRKHARGLAAALRRLAQEPWLEDPLPEGGRR